MAAIQNVGCGPVIISWLQSLVTPCPWHLRRMGYLREQLAIEARYRRNRLSWGPHLEASRKAVLQAIERCPQRRTVLVLGAGLLHDVPLVELAAGFERVVLVDILHLPNKRRRGQAAGAAAVIRLDFDCTGVVYALWRAGNTLASDQAERLFLHASPELPSDIVHDCDLTLSMNLASQLGNLPADWLACGRSREEDFSLRLRRAAGIRHVEWLRGLPGVQVMLADRAVVVREADGSESEREVILGDADIEPPQEAWVWRLAPIPEWDRHHHLELEVGVWEFGSLENVPIPTP